jgi:polyhydroxyalkanoate synthase
VDALKVALEKNPPKTNPRKPDDSDPFASAVDHEIQIRLAAFSSGVNAYRNHPYRRVLEDPPVIWSDGSTRLLDYGPVDGKPVLFVPSLINRAYILDLSERRSLLRWMAAETGLRPLLVDWDKPGPDERRFTLTDYIAGPLEAALTQARLMSAGPIPVVGYCMGGLLALALAARRAADISGLVLLATPWNFHAERVAQAESLARAVAAAGPLLETYGELPVDIIQAMFSALDPFLVTRKFIHFSQMDMDSQSALDFVALEDWLNDGVPLSGPVAHECMGGWYGRNTPHQNIWTVGGKNIVPQDIDIPSLVLVPQQDRIVPPASANALAEALPHAECRNPRLGHIGMVAASRAKPVIWEPMADWLAQH